MKGIFNKTLVIALLVSVCGVRAEVTDMSGKQLFVAAATQLSKEAKDAAVAGLNAAKNSNLAQNLRVAGTSAKNGALRAFELSKPVLTASLVCAVRAKDGVNAFCAKHPVIASVTLFYATLFAAAGVCDLYRNWEYARWEKQAQEERQAAQANQVTEITQVDVDELNNHVIA